MTTVCVRRLFEEIHSERVVARDIFDHNDKAFSTAKYLWATWKAHAVMSKYLKHQFYEHPSIAAVLARHLADNHVKHDDSLASKVSSLGKSITKIEKAAVGADQAASTAEKSISALEKSLRNVISRLDRLESEKNKFQKNEQRRNGGITPP